MSIYSKLYTFQQHIIDKFADRENFGLFIDMGLGKTPLSLGFAEVNNCTKVIVITINSKALETEFDSGSWLYWAKQSSVPYTTFTKSSKPVFDKTRPELLLINYESLFSRSKDKTKRMELKDNVKAFIDACGGHNVAIIVDESHKMKNLQSQQTLAINAIKRSLTFRANKVYTYLLTGTPFTTGYIDLYSQLKTLGYPKTKSSFVDRFCIRGHVPGLLGWQQPIIGYTNIDELFNIIHEYAITVKSESVVDLPEKIFVEHVLPESEDFRMFTHEFVNNDSLFEYMKRTQLPLIVDSMHKTEDELEKSYDHIFYPGAKRMKMNNPFFRDIGYDITKLDPTGPWIAETAGTCHLRARQLSIGFQGNAEEFRWFDKRRLIALKHFLETNESNYVLFYNYTPELYELFDICTGLGYNVDVYCGEVKSLRNYEAFAGQSDAERLVNNKNIILANFASGSTGMNWQLYNQCIIFSMPLYCHYEQAIKRIHRLGQKCKTVTYHVFSQDNWLDRSMRKALEDSITYSDEMFASDFERIQSLSSDDTES